MMWFPCIWILVPIAWVIPDGLEVFSVDIKGLVHRKVILCICTYHSTYTEARSRCSPSTMCVPEIKLESPGLAASTLLSFSADLWMPFLNDCKGRGRHNNQKLIPFFWTRPHLLSFLLLCMGPSEFHYCCSQKNVDECFFIGALEIWLQQCKCLLLPLQSSIVFLSLGKGGPHDTSLPGQTEYWRAQSCEDFPLIIPAAESSRVLCHAWETTLQYMSPLP